MAEDKKIAGFKKFTELNKAGKPNEEEMKEVSLEHQPDSDDRPMNPNLPNEGEKVERMPSREKIIPKDQNIELGRTATEQGEEEVVEEGKDVKFYGKVAQFPKDTKASKTLNFLENVKISKKSIWYILVEKQNNELQMLKYNNRQGVDMARFVTDLKSYYLNEYKDDPKLCKLIENIRIHGATEFSAIQNIPNIFVSENKKMITKITEDLIKLLSI